MSLDFDRYQQIVSGLVPCAEGILSAERIQQFQEHITNKLSEFKPTLMVYGTYNAGKSTLLNALFGEALAKTADVPATAVIQPYEFHGFTIYDTPGINAPIEHEKISREHLEKCELVLFVLSNDGSFEEEFIYNEICQIVKSNKPLLIVLNNKKNMAPDSPELKKEMDKINDNLSKIGDRAGIERIEDKVDLIMVDALTALEGKLEQEPALIEESHIEQLEQKIMEYLNQAGNAEVINALNLFIRNFADELVLAIDARLDVSEIQQTEELLTFVDKLKNKSKLELCNKLHQQMNLLQSGLQERLIGGENEEAIKQYIYDTLNEFSLLFKQKIAGIDQQLCERLDQFSVEMDGLCVDHDKIRIDMEQDSGSTDWTPAEEAIKSILKNKEAVSSAAKEALLKLRESKILFKGKWKKTLEKYAGKFAVVINVAVSAYEVYQAISGHNKQVEEQKRRILWAKNQSEEIVFSLKNDISQTIEAMMNTIFDEILVNFGNSHDRLNEHNKTLLDKKKQVQQLTASLP